MDLAACHCKASSALAMAMDKTIKALVTRSMAASIARKRGSLRNMNQTKQTPTPPNCNRGLIQSSVAPAEGVASAKISISKS